VQVTVGPTVGGTAQRIEERNKDTNRKKEEPAVKAGSNGKSKAHLSKSPNVNLLLEGLE